MLPMGVALAAVRLVFTRSIGAGASRRLPLWGALVAAAGLAWLARMPAQPAFWVDVLGPTLAAGAGLGMRTVCTVEQAFTEDSRLVGT